MPHLTLEKVYTRARTGMKWGWYQVGAESSRKLPEMPKPYYLVLGTLFGSPAIKLKKRHKLWFPTTEHIALVYGEGQPNLVGISNYGTIHFYAEWWKKEIQRKDNLKNWYESWHNG